MTQGGKRAGAGRPKGTGKVIIAVINGELTVKRLHQQGDQLALVPENPLFEPLQILEAMNFEVWGVVTHVIHAVL